MDWSKPITVDNCLFKIYEIGAMEHPADLDGGVTWRQYLTPFLNSRGIYPFNPTVEEVRKVGLPTEEFLEKLNDLQEAGNYIEFVDQMRKIWKGVTYTKEEKGQVETIHYLGDCDYVDQSKFLVWYFKENDKCGGTYMELALAWTKGIPVYLVTEMPISKMNKSILYFLLDSGHGQGRVFKTFKGLLQFLDRKYNLTVKKD